MKRTEVVNGQVKDGQIRTRELQFRRVQVILRECERVYKVPISWCVGHAPSTRVLDLGTGVVDFLGLPEHRRAAPCDSEKECEYVEGLQHVQGAEVQRGREGTIMNTLCCRDRTVVKLLNRAEDVFERSQADRDIGIPKLTEG